MNIAYHCKICKKQGITVHSDECPPSWVKSLAPMLCCNACVEKRQEYLSSLEDIGKICAAIQKLKAWKYTADELRGKLAALKPLLTIATKRYAAVMARINNLSNMVWMDDFVDQLMESPDKANGILRHYRTLLRNAANQ